MRISRWVRATLVAALVVAGAACGDDGDDGDDAGTTTTAADAAAVLGETATTALTQGYGTGTSAVAPGTMSVAWFHGPDSYVAVYSADGIADLPPLCPGNSLSRPPSLTDFVNVTNAPTGEGGCSGIESPAGEVRVCDDAWIYTTAIPLDADGTLYASVSTPDVDAGVLGITLIPASRFAEIDLDADRYTVEAGVLEGDATELDCS
jgi:hypothetical protein